MSKALIIFGTTTGNTEAMSDLIQKTLNENGMETEIKNVIDASISDLNGGHDLVLLGCPAYGDDAVELQEDFEDFYQNMAGIDLGGKKFAIFAPGDSSYEHFCGTVDLLEEEISGMDGKIVADGLKIDGDPDDAVDEIKEWSAYLVKTI